MKENYIAMAVPVFLGGIFLEWLADRMIGKDSYDLGDSVADLGCGVLSQVFSVVLTGGILSVFGPLYAAFGRFALFSPPPAAAWLLALVGVDFAYYWWHRLSHEVNFLWAMHVVHHQSPRYNLAVALRQASFSVAISWVVYVPIALLGVPLPILLGMMSINTLYQFWIHTRLVGRLGPLESFLNTPSHHRVHHGVDAKYIDKNYGGILISWDRLFGSFQREEEEPEYGITTGFPSLDPGWANLHYWFELAELSRQGKGFDKIKVWFMYPGWRPQGVDKAAQAPETEAPGAQTYAAIQLGASILALSALYRLAAPWTHKFLWGAAIGATMLSIGRLMDRKPWARALEKGRVAALAGFGLAFSIWVPSAAAVLWLWAGAAAGALGWTVSRVRA